MAFPKRPRSLTVLCTSSIGWDVPGLFGSIWPRSYIYYICEFENVFGVWEWSNTFIYKEDIYMYIYICGPRSVRFPFQPCRTVAQILAACLLMVLWTPSLDIQEETARESLGLWLVNTGRMLKTHGASLMGSVFQCGKTCKFCNVLTHVDVPYTVWQKWFSIVCNPTPCNNNTKKKYRGPTPLWVSSGGGIWDGRIFCWARQSITMHALVRGYNSLSRSPIPSSTQKVES